MSLPPAHTATVRYSVYVPRCRRPRPRLLVILVIFCLLYASASQRVLAVVRRTLALRPPARSMYPPPPPLPPLPLDQGMAAIASWEASLPSRNVTTDNERYLRYLNENWGVGFNNQLQEIIVHAHLAYLTNRSYVVPPLNFAGENAWYPLSAFVRGTLVGSPSPDVPDIYPDVATDAARDPVLTPMPPPHPLRAVSRTRFLRACPAWQNAPEANYTAFARRDLSDNSTHVPSYLTLSFTPLAAALGFEANPPADVIMRGWAGILRPGGGILQTDQDAPSGDAQADPVAPGDATCVTVHAASEHVFDYRLFGSLRILSLLPALLNSPVLRDLHWSALVHAAAQRNLRKWGWVEAARGHVNESDAGTYAYGPEHDTDSDLSATADTHAPLARTLALHIRRGDYEAHCVSLRKWGAGFLGVNEAEGMSDRYTLPPGGATTPAEQAVFARHCWPSLEDIMQHVRRVRREWELRVRGRGRWHVRSTEEQPTHARDGKNWRLNRVYVSTNGDAVWWATVTDALRADGWEVRGSADMDFVRDGNLDKREVDREGGGENNFDSENDMEEGALDAGARMERERTRRKNRLESERVVGLAVDMEVAARAEVFIGNGWSSFTSNVNLLRMTHGAPRVSIRFW